MNGIFPEKVGSLKDQPKKVMLLGYGAIGKCFTEMLLNHLPDINLMVVDLFDYEDSRFQFLKFKVTKDNIPELLNFLNKRDLLVDLSVCVDFIEMWRNCMERGIMYLNTACEEWGDSEDPITFPKTENEMYLTSIPFLHDQIERSEFWRIGTGTTAVIEHGMNPGLISHFSKKALLDAAYYFMMKCSDPNYNDLDFKLIEKHLKEKNYPKLAQALGLHTIHCSEIDDQWVNPIPKDVKTKFYNTWSCRGFLTEALIPIQVSCGSHETIQHKEFPVVKDGTCIMSWGPSYLYEGIYFN
jgi:homospermidine synthase